MDWRDHGILLGQRRHGETSAIIEVFTRDHGRHAGIVRGGTSRKIAPILQPGAQLDVTWRARLEDHMGSFTVEPMRSRAAAAMSGRLALAGLNAVCALLRFCLPEREAHHALYQRSEQLLDLLGQDDIWPLAYLKWEMALLEEMGFGLDLSACAATGTNEELIYVSPRSGKAVSRQGAGEWADRMLPLPDFLGMGAEITDAGIAEGYRMTGYFLENKLAPALGHKPLPEARARFTELFTRLSHL
ncbi:DNA repair protein RecO [Phaeobacter sp. 22II1-1F12B]|uniref:DNA repair protein RecO n=1 Tax=Phaeobacter sp. 22II1-1F12B TaxID=1317111 RepID=UPI000B5222BD|nr:DNA repair protein RecO [Phaeobacter sp. 22II1-1F12B]OWU81113.1 DNA recombination protein RecO [Phaeobacter sp. 22II1-1F12B]